MASNTIHDIGICLLSDNHSRAGSLISCHIHNLFKSQPEISANQAAALLARDCANLFPRLLTPDVFGEPVLEPKAAHILNQCLRQAFKNQRPASAYFCHAVDYPALAPQTAETLRTSGYCKTIANIAARNNPELAPGQSFESALRRRLHFTELLLSGLSAEQEHAVLCLVETGCSLPNVSEALYWREGALPILLQLANGPSDQASLARQWFASLRNTQWDIASNRNLIQLALAHQESAQLLRASAAATAAESADSRLPKRAAL